MRCKICNIDVSENTKRCPLCGADTVEEAPLLPGIKTAYYPKVKYKKPQPPYNLISTLAWFVLSLLTLFFDIYANDGDLSLTLFVATTIPCIWSFLLRPMYTHYYYFGRYIVSDTIFLSLWTLVISSRIFESAIPAVSYMIPAVLTIAVLVFLFSALFVKKDAFRAPPFILMLGGLALLMSVITVFISGVKFYFYLIPLALALVSVAILFAVTPKKVKEELQARFHA